jgi:hypothetical protein
MDAMTWAGIMSGGVLVEIADEVVTPDGEVIRRVLADFVAAAAPTCARCGATCPRCTAPPVGWAVLGPRQRRRLRT